MLSSFAGAAESQSVTTTVAANPTSVPAGGSVTLTATVEPAISGGSVAPTRATGTVTFLDGNTPLNATPIPLGAGDAFRSSTFQQAFGTVDPALENSVQGELAGNFTADGQTGLIVYQAMYASAAPYGVTGLRLQAFASDDKGGYVTLPMQALQFGSTPIPSSGVVQRPVLLDVDGDGRPDLLYGSFVAHGNGDGTFEQPAQLAFLASGFAGSYAADVNGDGKTDILAVNTPPSSWGPSAGQDFQYQITVFENQGSGTFASIGTFPISLMSSIPPASAVMENVFNLSFADMNGDGKLDIMAQTNVVFAGNATGTDSFTAVLNNGDGTFGSPTLVDTSQITYPSSTGFALALADMNGDRKADMVLEYPDANGHPFISVQRGNGDGTFQSAQVLQLNTGQFSAAQINTPLFPTVAPLVVEDVNLDGKPDVVLGSGMLALGNGDGTLTQGSPLFPAMASNSALVAYPVVLANLSGSTIPSLVFLNLQADASAVFTPQVSGSASLTLGTLAAGAHSITAQYSGDANHGSDTSQPVTVTVTAAPTATAITSSANPSPAGQSVTFTANVTGSGPMPTGTVTFSSGGSTLGTSAVSGGSATYTATFSSAGNTTVTASYSGDSNNQASSASVSQAMVPAVDLAPGSGGNTSIAVQSGQSATTPVSITGASGFAGNVTFSCTSLPQKASCSFNPATVSMSGAGSASTTLTVHTSGTPIATADLTPCAFGGGATLACGLVFLWPSRRRRPRFLLIAGCTLGLAVLGAMGCGGNSNSNSLATATPSGTYTFNVVANAGSAQTTMAYTLTVQ